MALTLTHCLANTTTMPLFGDIQDWFICCFKSRARNDVKVNDPSQPVTKSHELSECETYQPSTPDQAAKPALLPSYPQDRSNNYSGSLSGTRDSRAATAAAPNSTPTANFLTNRNESLIPRTEYIDVTPLGPTQSSVHVPALPKPPENHKDVPSAISKKTSKEGCGLHKSQECPQVRASQSLVEETAAAGKRAQQIEEDRKRECQRLGDEVLGYMGRFFLFKRPLSDQYRYGLDELDCAHPFVAVDCKFESTSRTLYLGVCMVSLKVCRCRFNTKPDQI